MKKIKRVEKIYIAIVLFFTFAFLRAMEISDSDNPNSQCDISLEIPLLKFGNQIYSPTQLNQLSPTDKEFLIDIASPSCFSDWQGYNYDIIKRTDYDRIIKFLPENMKQGLQIKVVDSISKEKDCCIRHWPKICAGITFFGGVSCFTAGIVLNNPTLITISIPFIASSPFLGCMLESQIETSRTKTVTFEKH